MMRIIIILIKKTLLSYTDLVVFIYDNRSAIPFPMKRSTDLADEG